MSIAARLPVSNTLQHVRAQNGRPRSKAGRRVGEQTTNSGSKLSYSQLDDLARSMAQNAVTCKNQVGHRI